MLAPKLTTIEAAQMAADALIQQQKDEVRSIAPKILQKPRALPTIEEESTKMAEVGNSFKDALTQQQNDELRSICQKMLQPRKGILAAESIDSIGKRFESINVENNEENRRKYRQLLITPPIFGQNLSGVLVFDEIEICHGGLNLGKWCCLIHIGPHKPSHLSLTDNGNLMVQCFSCKTNGMVPIVQAKISNEIRFNEITLAKTFSGLGENRIYLEGTLLKPNMVTPGQSAKNGAIPKQIGTAMATIDAVGRSVPIVPPGVVFLSGGQSKIEDAFLSGGHSQIEDELLDILELIETIKQKLGRYGNGALAACNAANELQAKSLKLFEARKMAGVGTSAGKSTEAKQ